MCVQFIFIGTCCREGCEDKQHLFIWYGVFSVLMVFLFLQRIGDLMFLDKRDNSRFGEAVVSFTNMLLNSCHTHFFDLCRHADS